MTDNWVQLMSVKSEMEREIILSLLTSQGIEAFVKPKLPLRVYPGLAPVTILIREKDLASAKAILKEPSFRED